MCVRERESESERETEFPRENLISNLRGNDWKQIRIDWTHLAESKVIIIDDRDSETFIAINRPNQLIRFLL